MKLRTGARLPRSDIQDAFRVIARYIFFGRALDARDRWCDALLRVEAAIP
jgi:hypothetical protein